MQTLELDVKSFRRKSRTFDLIFWCRMDTGTLIYKSWQDDGTIRATPNVKSPEVKINIPLEGIDRLGPYLDTVNAKILKDGCIIYSKLRN